MIGAEQVKYGFEDAQKTASHLKTKTSQRPSLAIVCGSGLGGLADSLQEPIDVFDYSDIPNFPRSTVIGHAGKLIFGTLSGKQVVLMKGRSHMYEGNSPEKAAFPVRVFKQMGISTIILTNAAGAINRSYKIGDLMIIRDHIDHVGFAGKSPLVGNNDERFGPRFPPMSRAYDQEIRDICKDAVKQLDMQKYVHEGTYSFQCGPSYETGAESRMLLILGADVAGMSTVPEVLVAVHCGIRVFGLSLVTNVCAMETDHEQANGQEVIDAGQSKASDVQSIISLLVKKLDVQRPASQ